MNIYSISTTPEKNEQTYTWYYYTCGGLEYLWEVHAEFLAWLHHNGHPNLHRQANEFTKPVKYER